MAGPRPKTLNVSIDDLAKMIDHSLLHPTMTDDDVAAGLQISKKYSVATACVKPYHILFAKKALEGSSVLVCPVIGFPHGNSTTEVKVFEARRAAEEGGKEIDMVVNIGRVLSGKWEFVAHEILAVNTAVVQAGAILKVIFENDCQFPFSSCLSQPLYGRLKDGMKMLISHIQTSLRKKSSSSARSAAKSVWHMSRPPQVMDLSSS
jgi:hypothetical protein